MFKWFSSDHFLSGDSLTICLYFNPSVFFVGTFSTSSSEPLGEFQQNLAQKSIGFREFKFIKMKRHARF